MTKNDIANVFERIGTLLDLKGENPFKVRAYQSAARLLETMSEEEFGAHATAADWGAVKGVGDALASKIEQLLATGKLEFFEKLRASVPAGLVEMLEIPGLGPKKVRALNERLGITDIDGLRKACQDGRIESLEGFGAKTQEKILAGIDRREAYAKRHLWWDAALVAERIAAGLRNQPGVKRAEPAGSLRRGLETVGDLDFIVAAANPEPVMDWFSTLPEVAEVTGRGGTKCSVRFDSGLQADLRIVPEEGFAFALHHFTGSKQHNILMRQRALERGWSLSEWGLSPAASDSSGAPVPRVDSEADLFAALGLAPIPPELREGMDELEAAQRGPLPRLVELADLRGAFHNHTTESDGSASLAEMAEEAGRLGWEYLGIADHSKASFQAHGLDAARLARQVSAIRSWNARSGRHVHLFAGTECDILPDGSLDFDDEVLATLDYVVASVHSGFTQDEDTMTRRIVRALENPWVTMLGHATGRLLLRREPYAVNLVRVVDAAIANGVIIELNADPHRLDLDWRHWHRAAERGLLCSINPDAHSTAGLSHVRTGVRAARKGWLTPAHVLNTRPLAEVEAHFAARRARAGKAAARL
ncbi:DNA polymerase/3'-5' exonuclease PolX [mine drainage metagenome]|uniref:DNA-directed DNA polymerase n=1 Tax=mine drainage metagenome TaxID=410659 RepID=A0A1J5S6I2_9ZZZZ